MGKMGITAGLTLHICQRDMEKNGEDFKIDYLTKEDGSHPTALEAVEYLKTLDPNENIVKQ